MRELTIDCRGFAPRTELHKALAEALQAPDCYGNNLDALHDMLTDLRQDTTLILQHFDREAPDNRGLLCVLQDSQKENKHLKILFE